MKAEIGHGTSSLSEPKCKNMKKDFYILRVYRGLVNFSNLQFRKKSKWTTSFLCQHFNGLSDPNTQTDLEARMFLCRLPFVSTYLLTGCLVNYSQLIDIMIVITVYRLQAQSKQIMLGLCSYSQTVEHGQHLDLNSYNTTHYKQTKIESPMSHLNRGKLRCVLIM